MDDTQRKIQYFFNPENPFDDCCRSKLKKMLNDEL